MLSYLLRRYVERHRSQIYFRVRVDARQNEKYSCTDAYLGVVATITSLSTKRFNFAFRANINSSIHFLFTTVCLYSFMI